MGRVVIVAINRAGNDDLQRRLTAFHGANLHRRSMSSQQVGAGDEKSILHVARRMVFGNIERFEVVIIVLDIGTAGDFETHAQKDLDDLVDHQRYRVAMATLQPRPRQGDIDFFFGKGLGLGLPVDRSQSCIELLLQSAAQLIEPFAHARPFFRWQIFQTAQ